MFDIKHTFQMYTPQACDLAWAFNTCNLVCVCVCVWRLLLLPLILMKVGMSKETRPKSMLNTLIIQPTCLSVHLFSQVIPPLTDAHKNESASREGEPASKLASFSQSHETNSSHTCSWVVIVLIDPFGCVCVCWLSYVMHDSPHDCHTSIDLRSYGSTRDAAAEGWTAVRGGR